MNGHPFLTVEDLSKSLGGRRCKECRRQASRRYREKQAIVPVPKRTILQIGECRKGHPIRGLEDVYVCNKPGRTVNTCKICSSIKNKAAKARRRAGGVGYPNVRRWVSLECSCNLLFTPPLPEHGEQLWCSYHRAYSGVTSWGEVLPRHAIAQVTS